MTPRVLAVADTDSYLKWSAATLRRLPAEWSWTQLVLRNPVQPSAQQMTAAGAGSVQLVDLPELTRRIGRDRPDVVLLAATGPVVETLTALPPFRRRDRPLLVTGLPGMSIPASARAVRHRSGCDLFLVHSRRELTDFAALGARLAPGTRFALARLPFLESGPTPVPGAGTDLLFAAQAKVPAGREKREQVLLGLAAHPSPVLKVRALGGEQQTHAEAHPYPELLADLEASGRLRPGTVRVVGGSMTAALARAEALVTVSSTAALEAMAAELPVLVLSDFGVSAELLNEVFTDSGCLGTLEDVRDGRLRRADPAWRRDNYFHPASDNTWGDALDRLLGVRARVGLTPRRRPRRPGWARVRSRLRLAVPARAWPALRRARRALRP